MSSTHTPLFNNKAPDNNNNAVNVIVFGDVQTGKTALIERMVREACAATALIKF